MAAIDLLLNWSPTSERMHQVVLTGLLRHTRLLELLGISGTPTDLKIETQNRLYDFTVMVLDGTVLREVHIELKVDAALGGNQIKRQMAAVADGDLLLYVLIGITRFTWSGMKLEELRAKLDHAPSAGAVRIVGLAEMRDAISALAAHAVDENHRDLAVAYGSLLRKIHNTTSEFESKPLLDWKQCGYDWFGLFSEMVRRLDLRDAGMGFVNTFGSGIGGSQLRCDGRRSSPRKRGLRCQAKRWKDVVGSPEVMKFSGSLTKKHANRGVFITTSWFSPDAIEYVKEMPQRIILIDGRLLSSLMIEYNAGVAPAKTYTLKRLDQDYFENL